jgi:hypothetical protein
MASSGTDFTYIWKSGKCNTSRFSVGLTPTSECHIPVQCVSQSDDLEIVTTKNISLKWFDLEIALQMYPTFGKSRSSTISGERIVPTTDQKCKGFGIKRRLTHSPLWRAVKTSTRLGQDKYRDFLEQEHNSTSQKILSFMLAAVRTWNLTKYYAIHTFCYGPNFVEFNFKFSNLFC